jgi:PAS domain S-box-containing protein
MSIGRWHCGLLFALLVIATLYSCERIGVRDWLVRGRARPEGPLRFEPNAEAKQCADKDLQRWHLFGCSYQFGRRAQTPRLARRNASQLWSHLDFKCRASDVAEYSSTRDDLNRAEPPMHGHEANVAAILVNTPFLLARCSSDLRYLFVSEAYAQMLGLRPEDFDGKSIIDIMGEEGFQTILPHVQQVLRGERVEYEADIHYAGAGRRRVLVRYTPDRDRSGNTQGWVASILDLTDQRKADARIAADLKAMTILREMGSLYVRKDVQLDECLQRTMDAAIAIVGADKGNIQIFEASSNSLIIAAQCGFAEPFMTFFEHVRDDAATCAAAMRMKNQVIVEDVLESDIFIGNKAQAVLIDAGVRAVVSTPLLSSNGTLMGMISTHYANPHRPTDREVHLIQVLARQAADYLERKRAEHIEMTFVRELNHRCNNLLAVVQALANQSLSTHHIPAEARTAFVARLQALARATRQMTKSDWGGVELHEIVEAELEPFSPNVTVEGSPIKVDPQHAQRLSLAVHELVTNASKYGALSSAVGTVHLSWAMTGQNSLTLHFRWRESGGPRVVAPEREGFGTTLLKGMFAGIRLDYLEEGLDCTFDMKF